MKGTRVAYMNGEFLPEPEVRVSFRDRGFVLGDAVFDAARTFNGKIFRLVEHVDRLYRSLEVVQIVRHRHYSSLEFIPCLFL